jgi:hypothetical protein
MSELWLAPKKSIVIVRIKYQMWLQNIITRIGNLSDMFFCTVLNDVLKAV